MTDSWNIEDGHGAHALDENQQFRRGDGYGVVDPGGGACEVTTNTQTLGQADTLSVAAGDVLVNGTAHSISQQSVGLDAANSTSPRRDVIYIDSGGSVQVGKGSPESVKPDDQNLTRFQYYRPAPVDLQGTVATVLAEVWVAAGASSVSSDDIRDRRQRALGPHSLDDDIATQSELDSHANSSGAHHTKYTDEEAQDAVGTNLGEGLEYDDPSGAVSAKEPFVYAPGMTEWTDGLSNEEVDRIALQTGEVLVVERIEFRQKGGGSSASASIDVRDTGAGSTIGSQDLGGTTKDPGSSNSGNTVIIRVSNSTGGVVNGAPRVLGWIEGA